MDVTARWSSGRVLATAVLAFLSLLLTFSHGSEGPSFSFHDKRDTRLILRQDNASSTTTYPLFASPTVSTPLVNTSSEGPSFTPQFRPPPPPSTLTISSIFPSSSSTPSVQTTSQATSTHHTQSSRSSYSFGTELTIAAIYSTTAPTATPETTSVFSNNNNLVPTTTVDTTTTPPSETVTNAASSVASTGSSFWQNKAGVAATFVISSLLIAGALVFGIISWLRKRNIRRQNRIHAELFEKFSASSPDDGSPSPSISAAPMDPSGRREVRYDNAPPFHTYGVSLPQIQQSTSSIQNLDHYRQAPLRYSPPSHSVATTAPGAFREPNFRTSYQPSIDSFYGGPASNKF